MGKRLLIGVVCCALATSINVHAKEYKPFASFSLLKPVGMAQFVTVKATIQNKKICLKWEVLANQDVYQFVVESTADKKHFNATAIVFGTDVQEKASYKCFHKWQEKIKAFRIKLITKKGEIVYSSLITPKYK